MPLPVTPSLLTRINRFLAATAMPPSLFGRRAAGDPRLVSDLRRGRQVGSRLEKKLEHFMNIFAAMEHDQ